MPVETSYLPRPSIFNANAIFVSFVSRCSLAVLMARSRLALAWETSPELPSRWLSKLWEAFAKGGQYARRLRRSCARSHRIQDLCCDRAPECRASSFPLRSPHDVLRFSPRQSSPGLSNTGFHDRPVESSTARVLERSGARS